MIDSEFVVHPSLNDHQGHQTLSGHQWPMRNEEILERTGTDSPYKKPLPGCWLKQQSFSAATALTEL